MSGVAFIEGWPHVWGALYRGVSSRQGWPLSGVAIIEGCPLYRIVLTSGLAFIEGCPHVRGGLYRRVSSHQG